MNPNYKNKVFPELIPLSFESNFPAGTPELAISFLKHLLVYNPSERPGAIDALAHPFFTDMRMSRLELPGSQGAMPVEMYSFTQNEYNFAARVIEQTSLIPEWLPQGWMNHIDRYAKNLHPSVKRMKQISTPQAASKR